MSRELSVFADESGGRYGHSKCYLLTLVFHDHAEPIGEKVAAYERSLAGTGLPDIPFHSEPLLNGHGLYENINLADRKKMLYAVNMMVQRLPISYRTFAYRRSEYEDPSALSTRMKRDISGLLFNTWGSSSHSTRSRSTMTTAGTSSSRHSTGSSDSCSRRTPCNGGARRWPTTGWSRRRTTCAR